MTGAQVDKVWKSHFHSHVIGLCMDEIPDYLCFLQRNMHIYCL